MNDIPTFAAHHRKADDHWQTVLEHLLGVAGLSARFADKLKLGRVGELIGLLHDLGKYSLAFQVYLKSATGALNQDEDEDWVDAASLKGKVDHSTAGAQWVWQALAGKGEMAMVAGQMAALCIASHHSGLIDCIAADQVRFGDDGFGKRMLKVCEKTHLAEALRVADTAVLARCESLLADPDLVAELTSVLRNVGQANRGHGKGSQATFQQLGLVVRYLFSCLIDADRTDTANFEHPRDDAFRPNGMYTGWPTLQDRLEKHLRSMPVKRPIDVLRCEISEHCRQAATRSNGIYTLTVPTGGGKTLASLRFALHHAGMRKLDRIIYVIPFTSIIDQNAQVVRSILEPTSAPDDRGRIVLEHHGSVTPEQQTWREKILCENWDAPVVYTTMVQFLEALFGSGTRGARRMHQLANTVLVFDEVQTLPIKCVHLFNNAVNFLAEQCNSTVLLCTATQPLLHQVDPARGAVRLAGRHELMQDLGVGKLFDQLKRVEMRDSRKPGGWTHKEVSELALSVVSSEGSCLVIVNTKAAAKQIFELASASLAIDSVYHLSTDMCPVHRKEELAKVRMRLEQGAPTLCVSTQLIEAGVDVDFRSVIRFLAGLDSIAQAAGRCNRNGRPEPGNVYIVNPQTENLARLPDIAIGRDKAQRVLDDYAQDPARFRHNLAGSEALCEYYQHYFFQRQAEMSYTVPAKQIGHDDTLLRMLSDNQESVAEHSRQHGESKLLFKQAFMTASKSFKAIDAPTQGIVVPFGKAGRDLINDLCAAFMVEKEFDLLRAAQQFTVNVFPHVLRELEEAKAVHTVSEELRILCLDPRFYSPRFGLSTNQVAPMEVSCA